MAAGARDPRGPPADHQRRGPFSRPSAAAHTQEIDGQDKIVELVNGVIVSLLQAAPERRPSAASVNRKFAKFIRSLLEEEEEQL